MERFDFATAFVVNCVARYLAVCGYFLGIDFNYTLAECFALSMLATCPSKFNPLRKIQGALKKQEFGSIQKVVDELTNCKIWVMQIDPLNFLEPFTDFSSRYKEFEINYFHRHCESSGRDFSNDKFYGDGDEPTMLILTVGSMYFPVIPMNLGDKKQRMAEYYEMLLTPGSKRTEMQFMLNNAR